MPFLRFPDRFLWGAATAAYQVEGAAADDGRAPSIWDSFSHIPGKITNNENGDRACDHYHCYRDDVALMKELGLRAYRFSIAWPRVFPDGRGQFNNKGVDFYRALVDELLRAGIEPVITLYHWDLPQALQTEGGWANRETGNYFADYAAYLFKNFGDRVTKWITINEPQVISFLGNATGEHAPGFTDRRLAVRVSHHLLLAHAWAVRAFRQTAPTGGRIGITLDLHPIYPASAGAADRATAVLVDGYQNRWFLDPVLQGSYPRDILQLYEERLRAPEIKPGDLETFAGNQPDFLGVNYYFRNIVKQTSVNDPFHFQTVKPAGALFTDMGWEVYPSGLYDLLTRIKRDYQDPHIYITENGAAFKDDRTEGRIVVDDDRLDYLRRHFSAAFQALEAGVKLDGYFIWSLLDNFEWADGYAKKFGLFKVNYRTQARLWKKSAVWYKEVIANNGFDGNCL